MTKPMNPSKFTREENVPLTLQPGHYYRCIAGDGPDIPAGTLVLITKIVNTTVHFVHLDHGWYTDEAEFMLKYEYAPHGKEERDREMHSLLSRLSDMRREEVELGEKLTNLDRPLIAPHQEEAENAAAQVVGKDEVAENQNTALLVQTPDAIQARRIKKGVSLIRNEAIKFEKRMKGLQADILRLKKEQEAYLDAIIKQASGLQKLVKVAEEVIWTVSIYLGRGEEIVQIQEGEPAEPGEKIAVRQLVLFADEEMAIRPLEGGADFNDLQKLDEWLKVPANLQQVLPNVRGVVAFRPRRKSKDYFEGDNSMAAAMANAEINKKNHKVYFLLRNGANLYRVTTDVEVGEVLVPTPTEFDSLFDKEEYEWGGRFGSERKSKGKTKVKPGTAEFAKAMEMADELQRHYGRTLLFLQGIIDRTKIFAPLIDEALRVNLLDRKSHESYIQYVYDAQNLLPTGKLPFWKWVQEVNKNVDVGHRIIGIFNDYDHGVHRRNNDGRIHPRGAELPENLALHTRFSITYKRTEKVYIPNIWVESKTRPGWGHYGDYRLPKTKASCLIYRDDRFYLDFDNVEVEDMRFYLQSRVDRHNYITMFPLLETCLELKERELQEEAPFRKLLIALMMKAQSVSAEEAELSVDELIKWWKLKNRTHRALLSNDKKAAEMIVAEYGLRLRRMDEVSKLQKETDTVVNLIIDASRELYPGTDLIYLGHKTGDQFIALVAPNEENLFVHEIIWVYTKTKQRVRVLEKREWRTVDGRRLRWKELHTGPRWAEWRFDARREQYLSGPEIESLIQGAWKSVEEKVKKRWDRKEEQGTEVFWPLAISLDYDQDIKFWVYAKKPKQDPTADFLADREKFVVCPQLITVDLHWKRKHGKVEARYFGETSSHYCHDNWHRDPKDSDKVERHWAVSDREKYRLEPGQVKKRLLWEDKDNIKKLDEEFERWKQAKHILNRWDDRLQDCVNQARTAMTDRWEAIMYQHFLNQEDGDPELWGDRLSELRSKRSFRLEPEGFEKACRVLITKEMKLVGKTVERILESAPSIKLSEVEERYLPLDLKIKPKKKGGSTQEDEETDSEEDYEVEPIDEEELEDEDNE